MTDRKTTIPQSKFKPERKLLWLVTYYDIDFEDLTDIPVEREKQMFRASSREKVIQHLLTTKWYMEDINFKYPTPEVKAEYNFDLVSKYMGLKIEPADSFIVELS